MKIVTIIGSPRKKGNTAKVLSMFEDEVKENHDVERIDLTQYKVDGCIGCFKCAEKPDEPGCVQNDDAGIIFDKMIQADAIVYASPVYFCSFTAQMKALIDRHVCLQTGYRTPDHSSLISGKRTALLGTLGGSVEEWCDPIQGIFKILAELGKLTIKGNFFLPFCDNPDAIGANGAELAGNLAKAITE